MTDPRNRTRFRVAQKWAFDADLDQVKKELVIFLVEEDPQQGIFCSVQVKLDPPFSVAPNTHQSALKVTLFADALERSVSELLEERALLPRWLTGSKGEFSITPEQWQKRGGWSPIETRELQTILKDQLNSLETARKAEEHRRAQPPPEPSHGLWSLIADSRYDELRTLLQEHPGLSHEPMPHDDEDKYCFYDGSEDEPEWYPLHAVAEVGDSETAKLFFEFGAEANKANKVQDTALHTAARSSNCYVGEIGRVLLEHGADPNARNSEGNTPLRAGYCYTALVEALVAYGAHLDLNHALRVGRVDWVRQQLRRDARVAMADAPYPKKLVDDFVNLIRGRNASEGFTSNRDILDCLLDNGCDPNGVSALFYAVQLSDTSLAEHLIRRGADPNKYLQESGTYLTDIARDPTMIQMLKTHGAKENPYEHER